jgi:hypothetical protein
MRLLSADELLKQEVRVQIVSEIEAIENQRRKKDHFMRTEIYKDQTKRFVIDQLLKQFDQSTVDEMDYAIANLSIAKKVIDKLAKVYANGVRREIPDDKENTKKLQQLEKLLDFNSRMKITNRWLKLNRNVIDYVKPIPQGLGEDKTWRVSVQPTNAYLYDAIEDFHDRTQPIAIIFTNYEEKSLLNVSQEPAKEGRTISTPMAPKVGDNKDQGIADNKVDEDADREQKLYIVWTDKWHFTFNEGGEIVNPTDPSTPLEVDFNDEKSLEQIINPISEMPTVNFAIDQDNSFWAQGGRDLIDGAILINTMISNLNHIGVVQGFGQLVLKGKNLPQQLKVGPNIAIKLEYDKDEDPAPDAQYISSSPPLNDLMRTVEMYAALLLTTNNLSTSGISTQLQGSSSFASGIALMIDKSESQEDIQDQRQLFLDNEPEIWRKINKWLQLYSEAGNLSEEFTDLVLPEGFEEQMVIKFNDAKVFMSESEKLDNLKKRKELGIDTMIDLIMADNGDLEREDAEKKLKEILEEKMQRFNDAVDRARDNGGTDSNNDSADINADSLPGNGNQSEDGSEADDERANE